MFLIYYERLRLLWRVSRAKRRATQIIHGEIELPLLPFIVPRKSSIDVGANKGILTYLLSRLSSRTVAYEANPKLFHKLNLALGNVVDLRSNAVSNKNGILSFYVPVSDDQRELPNIGSLKPNSNFSHAEYSVEAVRLDSENIDDVGFIKIDVEGTELDIIEGALTLIDRDRPVLMVEINDKHTPQAQKLEALMKERDYVIVDFSDKVMRLVKSIAQVSNRNVIFMPLNSLGKD